MFQLAPDPDTVISSLSPSVTPAAVDAIVIVLPDSLNVILEPASIVTFVLPLVFDDITLVVAVPAPTVRLPSFIKLPSIMALTAGALSLLKDKKSVSPLLKNVSIT